MATVEFPKPLEPADSIRLKTRERWALFAARIYGYMEASPLRVGLFLSIFYIVMVIPLALIKVMWSDEMITFYVAKLNSAHAIWNALARGVDPNPPLTHLLVMWCMRLFGDGAFSVRLPAMLGSLLGVVCLYLFLRPRLPVVYAAAGVCFYLSTDAFNYAYESRSYSLTLGLTMLAVLLWRLAIESDRKNLAAVGLALTLAAGLAANYFAVLAFFPIAAGEAVRLVQRRKVDFRIALALSGSAATFLFYLPVINHAVAKYAPHAWNRPTPGFLADAYTEMIEVILWPALVLLGAGLVVWYLQRRRGTLRKPVLPRHELAATFVLMAYPFVGYAIAVARAGMISPRFVIPMCFGFAIAAAVTGYRLFPHRAGAAVFMLIICAAWAFTRNCVVAGDYVFQRIAFNNVLDHLPQTGTIVVSDSLLILPLLHNAPPQAAARMVFPLDFQAIHKYKGEDSLEQNYWAGRNDVFPMKIVSANEIETWPPNYTILSTYFNWLLFRMKDVGMEPKPLAIDTHSRDIRGFTPLCHGDAILFEPFSYDDSGTQYASAGSEKHSDRPSPFRFHKRRAKAQQPVETAGN